MRKKIALNMFGKDCYIMYCKHYRMTANAVHSLYFLDSLSIKSNIASFLKDNNLWTVADVSHDLSDDTFNKALDDVDVSVPNCNTIKSNYQPSCQSNAIRYGYA
ncbi:serine hydroxymethyltransferase [Acrasis kona]|uniref:Serine hydroxymethyltransferase n=1 Tax=Acrasis kona TaxID=1008807 RepID=A0AAW2YLX5_9EUKA